MERVFKYKYLGVIFTSDLSWSEHIQSTSSKAKKLLSVLYRQFYRHSSSSILATLYKSIVRPHLEYASPVWNPYLERDIKLLESVQKMALKICTKHWNSSYEDNLAKVSLTSLAQRRDHLSLCYFYKLVNNIFCFPEAPLIPYTHTKFTRAGSKKLYVQPFAKTNYFKYSFFPRTINNWNNLPVTLQMSHSFYTFKHNTRTFC